MFLLFKHYDHLSLEELFSTNSDNAKKVQIRVGPDPEHLWKDLLLDLCTVKLVMYSAHYRQPGEQPNRTKMATKL